MTWYIFFYRRIGIWAHVKTLQHTITSIVKKNQCDDNNVLITKIINLFEQPCVRVWKRAIEKIHSIDSILLS